MNCLLVLVVRIIRVSNMNNEINLASRLTQLDSSYRLMFFLSFEKKFVVLAQLEAKMQSIEVQVV